MPTVFEYICCRKINKMTEKIAEKNLMDGSSTQFITLHPEFDAVKFLGSFKLHLDIYIYIYIYSFRHQYGSHDICKTPFHKQLYLYIYIYTMFCECRHYRFMFQFSAAMDGLEGEFASAQGPHLYHSICYISYCIILLLLYCK